MSMNSFGHLFRVTTWGESHGPALGATVDGCPPNVPLEPEMLQQWLDRRRPGQNKNMTQRNEPDAVKILSGVFEGKSTGTPTVNSGAATMKIISNTSMTSTIGVTLISLIG